MPPSPLHGGGVDNLKATALPRVSMLLTAESATPPGRLLAIGCEGLHSSVGLGQHCCTLSLPLLCAHQMSL